MLITGRGHRNGYHLAGLARPVNRGKLTGSAMISLAASQEKGVSLL